jgi:two-component sensor histidine kinase
MENLHSSTLRGLRAGPFRDRKHRDFTEMNHRIANSLQLTALYLKFQAEALNADSDARTCSMRRPPA